MGRLREKWVVTVNGHGLSFRGDDDVLKSVVVMVGKCSKISGGNGR